MGTSGAYTPSPKWAGIKTDLTNALNSGDVDGEKAQNLVGDFAQQLVGDPEDGFGDLPSDFGHLEPNEAQEKFEALVAKFPIRPTKPSGGGGDLPSSAGPGGGGGRSAGSGRGSRSGGRKAASAGRAVRPTAQRLAHFISEVPKVGLKQALANAGVPDADKIPADKLAIAIADVLLNDASQLVYAELRDALATVLEKLCDEPKTFDEAEKKLSESSGSLEYVVQSLFESYITERFKTFFCEHEAPKHGYEAADNILNEAREFISTEMDLIRADRRDLTAVDWSGAEGAKIVDAILERTIAVYTNK